METEFPPKLTVDPIQNRIATPDEQNSRRAAFSGPSDGNSQSNESLDIFLPRLATIRHSDATTEVGQVFQAEISNHPRQALIGYQNSDGDLKAVDFSQVEIWPCCFYFFQDPEWDLADLEKNGDHSYLEQDNFLFPKPGTRMFVGMEKGPHVQRFATEIADQHSAGETLTQCQQCFVVHLPDLAVALDEMETLVGVQQDLEKLTSGFLFLEWNDSLETVPPADEIPVDSVEELPETSE